MPGLPVQIFGAAAAGGLYLREADSMAQMFTTILAGGTGYSQVGTWGTSGSLYYTNTPGSYDEFDFAVSASVPVVLAFSWQASANRVTNTVWSVLDSDGTTVLASGTLDQTANPSGPTIGGNAFQYFGQIFTPTGTSLTLKIAYPASPSPAGNFTVAVAAYLTTSIPSVADGDWSTGGTWLGGSVPSATTPVQINNAVAITADRTVGDGSATTFIDCGNASGSLSITGCKLTIFGGGGTLGASNAGATRKVLTITSQAGKPAGIELDANAGVTPTISFDYDTLVHGVGLATDHGYIRTKAGSAGNPGRLVAINDRGLFSDFAYFDFSFLGDSSNPAISAAATESASLPAGWTAPPFKFIRCTFDHCGKAPFATIDTSTSPYNGIVDCQFVHCKWTNTVSTGYAGCLQLVCHDTLTTGTRLVQYNAFDQSCKPLWWDVQDFSIDDNVMLNNWQTEGTSSVWASFARNFLYKHVDEESAIVGPVSGCYYVYNPGSTTTLTDWIIPHNSGPTVSGCRREVIGGFDSTIWIGMSETGEVNRTVTAKLNVCDGCLTNGFHNPNDAGSPTVVAEHNTIRIGTYAALLTCNGSPGPLAAVEAANQMLSFRANLCWAPAPGTVNHYVDNTGRDGTHSDFVVDALAAANADYNGRFNLNNITGTPWSFVSGDTNSPESGTPYNTPMSGSTAPGTHDVSGDPQFVDSTRGIVQFDAYKMGTAGSLSNALLKLAAQYDSTDPNYVAGYTTSALLAWSLAGFVPRNSAYTARYDATHAFPGDTTTTDAAGNPTGGTVGAMAYKSTTGGSPSMPFTNPPKPAYLDQTGPLAPTLRSLVLFDGGPGSGYPANLVTNWQPCLWAGENNLNCGDAPLPLAGQFTPDAVASPALRFATNSRSLAYPYSGIGAAMATTTTDDRVHFAEFCVDFADNPNSQAAIRISGQAQSIYGGLGAGGAKFDGICVQVNGGNAQLGYWIDGVVGGGGPGILTCTDSTGATGQCPIIAGHWYLGAIMVSTSGDNYTRFYLYDRTTGTVISPAGDQYFNGGYGASAANTRYGGWSPYPFSTANYLFVDHVLFPDMGGVVRVRMAGIDNRCWPTAGVASPAGHGGSVSGISGNVTDYLTANPYAMLTATPLSNGSLPASLTNTTGSDLQVSGSTYSYANGTLAESAATISASIAAPLLLMAPGDARPSRVTNTTVEFSVSPPFASPHPIITYNLYDVTGSPNFPNPANVATPVATSTTPVLSYTPPDGATRWYQVQAVDSQGTVYSYGTLPATRRSRDTMRMFVSGHSIVTTTGSVLSAIAAAISVAQRNNFDLAIGTLAHDSSGIVGDWYAPANPVYSYFGAPANPIPLLDMLLIRAAAEKAATGKSLDAAVLQISGNQQGTTAQYQAIAAGVLAGTGLSASYAAAVSRVLLCATPLQLSGHPLALAPGILGNFALMTAAANGSTVLAVGGSVQATSVAYQDSYLGGHPGPVIAGAEGADWVQSILDLASSGTFPTAAQVLVGVSFGPTGNLTGTVVLPGASAVAADTSYGPGGGTQGTAPSPDDVAAAVWSYGNRTLTP